MVKNNNKFKRSLKYFAILGVINLLYLNLFLPLKLSFEQIFFISTEVVRVCDERGLDVSKLSAIQLDEIISLSLNSVKKHLNKMVSGLFLMLLLNFFADRRSK